MPVTKLAARQTRGPVAALADGATVTMDLAVTRFAKVTVAGNRAFTLSNDADDDQFSVLVTQDGTGGRTFTPSFTVAWMDAVSPNTGAGKATLYSFYRVSSSRYLGWRSTEQ